MGTVYQLQNGARLRSHAVPLKGINDEERLRALARALVNPIAVEPEVIALPAIAAPSPRAPDTRSPSSAKWWLAGGAGVMTVAGGVLITLDNSDECGNDPDCKYSFHSAPRGYVCLGIAAALALGSGYLFYRDSPRSDAAFHAGLAPMRDGIMASITGTF
jgi:hypothetical protein